jgi:hypothetical protein
MGFVTGGAMRLSVLGIALSGLLLPPHQALLAIFVWLTLFGLFQGMQGVIFNVLMAKVIPVSKRGRLTGSAQLSRRHHRRRRWPWPAARCFSARPGRAGYSYTFILAFVLTTCGLLALAFTREPVPPTLRHARVSASGLREIPGLLRADRAFARYVVARSLATAWDAWRCRSTSSSPAPAWSSPAPIWAFSPWRSRWPARCRTCCGAPGRSHGFRLVYLLSIALWVVATLVLMVSAGCS